MNKEMLERWKIKTKALFHKITYDEFWFYIDDLMKDNKRLTNNWNELEEYLKGLIDHFDENVSAPIMHEQMTIQIIYDYMKQIKENNK